MTLTNEAKLEIVGKHGKHEKDTGVPPRSRSRALDRITELTEHLRTHKKITTRGAAC